MGYMLNAAFGCCHPSNPLKSEKRRTKDKSTFFKVPERGM